MVVFDFFCVTLWPEVMKLHIFNPEHDLALAANLSNYTAPHAGRRLHDDLDFLPALWAAEGDVVLVADVDGARKALARVVHRSCSCFVTKHQLRSLPISEVCPWGWDPAIRTFLSRHGIDAHLLPSEATMEAIRRLSHRNTALQLLSKLRVEHTAGMMWNTDVLADVERLLDEHGRIVVKAPWSSSGRGIRFLDRPLDDNQRRWVANVLTTQGSIMVEPYYNKVMDLGMEFEADGAGAAHYRGLSLFSTNKAAYTGNILADEEEKRQRISRYIPVELLDNIKEIICQEAGLLCKGFYKGPFGVDMMILTGNQNNGFLLHPCVEVNLRRTMGHVALSLLEACNGALPPDSMMSIVYTDNHYKLKINRL